MNSGDHSFSANETQATKTFNLHSVTPVTSSLLATETLLMATTEISPLWPSQAFDAQALRVGSMIAYALIFVIGVPGNVLVLLTLIRIKKMRSVKNIFIANLAVGDLLNLLWCMTSFAVGLYIPWPFGRFVCTYIYPMSDVIIGNTIFTMVAIACDRYRAIVQPFSSKLTIRKSFIILLLLWSSAYLIMGFPLTMANQVTSGFWVSKVCSTVFQSHAYEISYRLTIFFSTFAVPFLLVLCCYIKIRRKLQENITFAMASIRSSAKLQRAKKNQRLIKMLLVIFMAFTICYLPVNILVLTHMLFREDVEAWPFASVLFQLAAILLFGNSIMNPIILFKLSRDYKYGFYSNIYCLLCCRSRSPDRSLSASVVALISWARRRSSRFSMGSLASASLSTGPCEDIAPVRVPPFPPSCFKSVSGLDVNHAMSTQLTLTPSGERALCLLDVSSSLHLESDRGSSIRPAQSCGREGMNWLSRLGVPPFADGREGICSEDRVCEQVAAALSTAPQKSVRWTDDVDLLESKPLVLKS